QMKIGHFTLSFVDLAIPVSGLDIEIIRTYDSRDKQPRDFGVGWNLDIRQGSYRNNRAPGDGWQLQTGFVACDTALESKSHLTVVRLSDQEVYRFALRLVRGVPRNSGGCSATAEFVYIDGPLPGTTLAILGNDQVFQETQSSNRVLDLDTLATYEPQQVRLTTRDGRIFELDLNDGVTHLEDLNGNALQITPSGITHSSGQGIEFIRDGEGRIERITDPAGQAIHYTYDAVGGLTLNADREGAETRFSYVDDHYLVEVENALGAKAVRTEYDQDGRMIRTIDALGRATTYDHDLDARREVVTNRLGFSRVLEYDARGNVIRETDENGKITSRSYDSSDLLLSETDPLGHTTVNTYSPQKDLLNATDGDGGETLLTYNDLGRVLTVTDPRGQITRYTYGPRGNPTEIEAADGNSLTLTYDVGGRLTTQTNADGGTESFEYDSSGNLIRWIAAEGRETTYVYNSSSRKLSETTVRALPGGGSESLTT
ncbi:MAG: RHS repeat protein, partial [Actinomycetia bacterium]|nr:RHS repeat protein [Actinomycetes bacterium]